MGHNSVVSGHPKSIGILRVDGLSAGPLDLGCHTCEMNSFLSVFDFMRRIMF